MRECGPGSQLVYHSSKRSTLSSSLGAAGGRARLKSTRTAATYDKHVNVPHGFNLCFSAEAVQAAIRQVERWHPVSLSTSLESTFDKFNCAPALALAVCPCICPKQDFE